MDSRAHAHQSSAGSSAHPDLLPGPVHPQRPEAKLPLSTCWPQLWIAKRCSLFFIWHLSGGRGGIVGALSVVGCAADR